MTPEQIAALKADEGAVKRGGRHVVYDDGTGKPIGPGSTLVGHPTCCLGRAADVNGFSDAEALYLFNNDVQAVEAELRKLAWFRPLDPVRSGVIEQLAFNMGVPNLLGFRRMIAAIEDANWTGAAAELMQSKWATQVQPERRSRLVAELLTGVSGGAVA